MKKKGLVDIINAYPEVMKMIYDKDSVTLKEIINSDSIYDLYLDTSKNLDSDKNFKWGEIFKTLDSMCDRRERNEYTTYGLDSESYCKDVNDTDLFYFLFSGTLPSIVYDDPNLVDTFAKFVKSKKGLLLIGCSPTITIDGDTQRNPLLDFVINQNNNCYLFNLGRRLPLHAHVTDKFVHFQASHKEYEFIRTNYKYTSQEVIKYFARSMLKFLLTQEDIKRAYDLSSFRFVPFEKHIIDRQIEDNVIPFEGILI